MKVFLVSLAVAVIGATVAWWLNQDTYHVKYTLSERIPVDFAGGLDESVQQLEVKNLSRKGVERIQVRLPASVTAHQVVKSSEADGVETYRTAKALELVYSALPPGSSFRVVFKTAGAGIGKDDVQVAHSRGRAEEALGSGSIFASVATWIVFGLGACYLVIIAFGFRSTSVDGWLSRAGFAPEKVLQRNKPLYVPENKWSQIREKAIEQFGEAKHYGTPSPSDIVNSPTYRLLNSPRPNWLSEEEWDQVRERRSKALMTWLSAPSYAFYLDPDALIGLAGVARPAGTPVDKWEAVQRTLQKQYVAMKLADYRLDTAAELQKERPREIDAAVWQDYQTTLVDRRTSELAADLEQARSPVDFLTSERLRGLPDKTTSRLKARAYKLQLATLPSVYELHRARKLADEPKPQWMMSEDHESYRAIVATILEAEQNTLSTAALQSALGDILRGVPANERMLERIEPSMQRFVQDVDREFGVARRDNAAEKQALIQSSTEIDTLKRTLSRQLQILHDVFREPASIERIEPYDNPFAPGNFKMLREFASALLERGVGP